ncbi:penicillin-binding protein activator [Glaciecola siphonariae]|uniref:Penicillin-binding protein activator n=1 Tax=Glaciecola siphonariae TaxID=521012 RepID=A0ABV9LZM4_9ALTE
MNIHRLIGLFIIVTLLCACAGSSQPERLTKLPEPVSKQPESSPKSAIERISERFERSGDVVALEKELVDMAQAFQTQNNCTSAQVVIAHASGLLQEQTLKQQSNIIMAECAVLQATSSLSDLEIIKLLENTLGSTNVVLDNPWTSRERVLFAYLQGLETRYDEALNALMQSDVELSPLASMQDQWVFYWLANLSFDARMDLIESYPRLFKYQKLLSVIEQADINDIQRQQKLKNLIANANTNSEFRQLPAQVIRFLNLPVNPKQNIAVLLPLSGRLSSQGEAIKQGIIAGYYDKLMPKTASADETMVDRFGAAAQSSLHFIDTGSQNELLSSVNTETLAPYSVVIGPLLKSHIDAVSRFAAPHSLKIFLNQSETDATNIPLGEDIEASIPAQYFALSPEQEATQLAEYIFEQGIAHPVIIHENAGVSERMALAFLSAWNAKPDAQTTKQPSQVSYSDNTSMRVGITSALDVLQSQQRINQLSRLTPEQVYSVTRNRRDVDAFVVFARPNELELINPIIESSMSLFSGQQTPVFATSLSYNHKQNKNTLRDLRNLVFLDMPFVLPQGRESSLANTVDTLFNEPSSTYLRLFAFGYDAISLTQQLGKLSSFDQLKIDGLTGALSLNQEQHIQRQLSTLAIDAGD